MSSMKSAIAPCFSMPKLPPSEGRELEHGKHFRYVPGPGSYTPKLSIGEKTTMSTYHHAVAKSFYHHDRFPKNVTKSVKCKYIS